VKERGEKKEEKKKEGEEREKIFFVGISEYF
jgi:hypothetical protein